MVILLHKGFSFQNFCVIEMRKVNVPCSVFLAEKDQKTTKLHLFSKHPMFHLVAATLHACLVCGIYHRNRAEMKESSPSKSDSSLKLWHKYVERLLAHNLANERYLLTNMKRFILKVTMFEKYNSRWGTELFLRLQTDLSDVTNHEQTLCSNMRLLIDAYPRNSSVMILRISGPLFLNGSIHFPRHKTFVCNGAHSSQSSSVDPDCIPNVSRCFHLDCSCTYRQSSFWWNFTLYKSFSINLTFTEISFVGISVNHVNGTLHCDYGNVEIVDFGQHSENFRFCGFFAPFNLYPSFTKFSVRTTVFPSTVFQIYSSFVVQDKNSHFWKSEQNVSQWNTKSTFNVWFHIFGVFLGLDDSYMIHFLVQVAKIHCIQIKKFQLPWLVHMFDGPSDLSPEMHPEHDVFVTSTFLAFAKLVFQIVWPSQHTGVLNILIQQLKINSTFTNLPLHLQLPMNVQCFSNMCLLKIILQEQLINVTVANVQYQGPDRESCKYGGFTTAEFLHGTYQENIILCKNLSHVSGIGRSLYSQTRTLFVILYWYPENSRMQVTATITKTHCSAVRLCPCTFTKMFSTSPNNTNMFYNFAQMFFLSPKLKLDCVSNKVFPQLRLKMKGDSCVALQIVKTQQCPYMCQKGHILALIISGLGYHANTTVMVKGSLNVNVNNEHLWTTCKYQCGRENYLDSRTFQQAKIFKTAFLYEQKSPLQKADKWKNLLYMYTTYFQLEEPLHSQNWIEIVIDKYSLTELRIPPSKIFPLVLPSCSGVGTDKYDYLKYKYFPSLQAISENILFILQNCFHEQFLLKWISFQFVLAIKLLNQTTEANSDCFLNTEVAGSQEREHYHNEEVRSLTLTTHWSTCHLPINTQRNIMLQTNIDWMNFYICKGCPQHKLTIYMKFEKLHIQESSQFSLLRHNGCDNTVPHNLMTLHFQNKSDFHTMDYILYVPKQVSVPSAKRHLFSWYEAHHLCQTTEGFLPYFTKQMEIQLLANFLKFGKHVHQIEAFFIGLYMNVSVRI